jgi:hypothetical protein
LTITDQNNEPVDVETLEREISSAKNSGTHGPTSITISENKVFGKKLRENEKLRESQSLLMPVIFYKTPKQTVAEGDDHIWGPQGRFAGDTPINVGSVSMKPIKVGDIVKYFGEKAKVLEVSPTNNYARISANGKTMNVRLSDLKQLGQGVSEAEKNPHTSALGKALYRDLSKEKKASPAQVEKNKARWAQRQADKEQGVAEGLEDKINASKPRNFVAKNATTGGAGAHKDKKKAAKQGDVKHKNKDIHMAEGAKVDRMAKHITQSEKKLGHSTKDAESIAWATINKREQNK